MGKKWSTWDGQGITEGQAGNAKDGMMDRYFLKLKQ
jgi:hypothetical protein